MKSHLLVCLLGALILNCHASFDFGDDDEEFWKIEQLKPRYAAGHASGDKRKQSSRGSCQKLEREPERVGRWKGEDKYVNEERHTTDHDGAYVRFSRSKSTEEVPSRRQSARRGRDYDSQEHSFQATSVDTRNKFFSEDSEEVHPKRSQGKSGYHSSASTRTNRNTNRDDHSDDTFQPTTTRSTRGREVSGQSDIRRVHTQSKTSCNSNPHVIIKGVDRTRQKVYGKDYLSGGFTSTEVTTSQTTTTEPDTTTNETTTTDGSDTTNATTTTDSNTTTESTTNSTTSTDASTTTNTTTTTTDASNITQNTTTGNDTTTNTTTEVPTVSDNTTTTTSDTTDSTATTTDNSTTTDSTTTTDTATTTTDTTTTDTTTTETTEVAADTTVSADTSADSTDSVTQIVVVTEDASNDAATTQTTEQPTVEQPQTTDTSDTQASRADTIDKTIKTVRGSLSTRKSQPCRCECENAAHHH